VVIVPAKPPEPVSPLKVPFTVELVVIFCVPKGVFTVPVPGPTVPLQVPLTGDAAFNSTGDDATKTTTTNKRNAIAIRRFGITPITTAPKILG